MTPDVIKFTAGWNSVDLRVDHICSVVKDRPLNTDATMLLISTIDGSMYVLIDRPPQKLHCDVAKRTFVLNMSRGEFNKAVIDLKYADLL